jgi:uncharacterized protein (DUF433 family)
MAETDLLARISFDTAIMGGRACIRGTRVTVATILDLIADDMSIREIVADYPYLTEDDVRAALAHTAWLRPRAGAEAFRWP